MASQDGLARVLDPDETWHMPAQLYLAARAAGAQVGPMLELREWGRQPVVLAYSSLDQFLEGCGADQPWMLLRSERLAELADDGSGRPAFSVLLDVPLTEDLRGTAGGMADTEAAWGEPESEDWVCVYVPSRPFREGDAQARLELQPMPGDRLALMAYSSRETLLSGCGPEQSWVVVPAGLVSEARRQSGADAICLDTPLPHRLRHDSAAEGQ